MIVVNLDRIPGPKHKISQLLIEFPEIFDSEKANWPIKVTLLSGFVVRFAFLTISLTPFDKLLLFLENCFDDSFAQHSEDFLVDVASCHKFLHALNIINELQFLFKDLQNIS